MAHARNLELDTSKTFIMQAALVDQALLDADDLQAQQGAAIPFGHTVSHCKLGRDLLTMQSICDLTEVCA